MSVCSALITDAEGHRLNAEEKSFFRAINPLGFTLFARNIESPDQVRALIGDMREATGNDHLLIFIDQEGGKVARMRPPHWRDYAPAESFATLAKTNLDAAKEAVFINARLIAEELYAVGINVDYAPVADIRVPGAHDIIGNRAYGENPELVAILAAEAAAGLQMGGVLAVAKHIPGHGRAAADSHEELPVVDTPLGVLQKTDFVPFRALTHLPFAMTAHVVYSAIDPVEPASFSTKVVDVIRNDIGFDGALMSDAIDMKALSGPLAERARKVLAAGCDIVLHCNGSFADRKIVGEATPPLSELAQARMARALAWLRVPAAFDVQEGKLKLAELLKNGQKSAA